MNTLRIYKVSDAYIRFLHSRDSRVQFNKDARRPYVGVVFDFGGFKYFAPLESPKPNHANMKPGKHLLKLKDGEYGLIGFNNMIPVHKDALIEFDINAEPDEKYKRLLQRQIALCNRLKADILNHAQMTYFDVVSNKNKFLVSISCDFKNLERACKAYRKDYIPRFKKDGD
ncbi:MAG: type III toxin-antitoxin system ToxN/AbiQ family toxin [Clostridia bacterium]|nr:type III toxin-antitoxin system ToxN/AbiQ family toxin [Clostridia bacterium]